MLISLQRRIQNPAKHLSLSVLRLAGNHFNKTLQLGSLTRFWIRILEPNFLLTVFFLKKQDCLLGLTQTHNYTEYEENK